jgi:hypothetical protein
VASGKGAVIDYDPASGFSDFVDGSYIAINESLDEGKK